MHGVTAEMVYMLLRDILASSRVYIKYRAIVGNAAATRPAGKRSVGGSRGGARRSGSPGPDNGLGSAQRQSNTELGSAVLQSSAATPATSSGGAGPQPVPNGIPSGFGSSWLQPAHRHSSLMGELNEYALMQHSGVRVGDGLPPVPAKLAERIWNWEFIDMVDLLPDQWLVKKEEPAMHFGAAAAHVGIPSQRGKKQVTDIMLWLQCFANYINVMSRSFPGAVSELLSYMVGILRVCQEYSGTAWAQYDATYRRQAASSGDRSWSKINPSLFSICFTGKAVTNNSRCDLCLLAYHPTGECPSALDDLDSVCSLRLVRSVVAALDNAKPQPDTAQKGGEVCRSFNANKCKYARCRFRHVCSNCEGQHAVTSCTRKQALQPYPQLGRKY